MDIKKTLEIFDKYKTMKNIITTIVLFFSLTLSAQKLVNIDKISIKNFHEKEELLRMQKGALKILYIDRLAVIINTLQYLPLTSIFTEDLSVLAIPIKKENLEAIEEQLKITEDFIFKSYNFQNKIIPYSNKEDLMDAILFYEEIIKNITRNLHN